jgi:hypothetical protein
MKSIMIKTFACLLLTATSVCFAMTIEGSGGQTRGYSGHDAERTVETFTLPMPCTIADVQGDGFDGFWIMPPIAVGGAGIPFNSIAQAKGYLLAAGTYRLQPSLRENPKTDSAVVRVTFNCP